MGITRAEPRQSTPLSTPAHPRWASRCQANRDELHARHTELLNGLTPAERHGLTIGLAGIARVLKNHH